MTCKKNPLLTTALLTVAFAQLNMAIPARADETVVRTTTVDTEPFVAVATVPSVVVLNAHTGARYPSSLRMVVGQKLEVKGNNAIDLLTMRYHQVGFNHCPSGKDVLTEISEKGYKDAFVASRPGETTLHVDGNSMFYGLIPWRSHTVHVTVVPDNSYHSLAEKLGEIQQ